MRLNEKIILKGHVKLTVFDAGTGNIIPEDCQEFDNLIVTNGYALLVDVLIGNSAIGYMGIGSGTIPATVDDINLQTPVGSRRVITTATRSGAIALFSTFFSSADNNGTWTEAILANALSGDNTIISRALFTNAFTKDYTKTAQLDWTIEIMEVWI